MTTSDLHSLIQSATPLLLHVLPPEVFRAKYITGSHNACVYEMTFLDQVRAVAPDQQAFIIVYGAGGGSLDASTAATKLSAAGYTNVQVFEEGIAGWESSGLPIDGTRILPQEPLLNGTFVVNTDESLIRWTGRNLFNQHHGTVRLADGQILLTDGDLTAACFSFDMKSIACEDLADAAMNGMLIRHLLDADFFDVSQYPTAGFTALSVTPIPSCAEGTPNYLLKGHITLRGITRPLEVPMVVAGSDGKRLTGQAQFELDRTAFGSLYGSGRFFRFLGKHLVSDHVHLHVIIHADLQK